MYFECVIKFTMPFTTVVMNGRITTSLIEQTFTPLRLYLGMLGPSLYSFHKLQCWGVPVSRYPQPVAILSQS